MPVEQRHRAGGKRRKVTAPTTAALSEQALRPAHPDADRPTQQHMDETVEQAARSGANNGPDRIGEGQCAVDAGSDHVADDQRGSGPETKAFRSRLGHLRFLPTMISPYRKQSARVSPNKRSKCHVIFRSSGVISFTGVRTEVNRNTAFAKKMVRLSRNQV